MPLSANVLHIDSKMGSRGDGNTTLKEVFRIAQDVTSDNFSVVGTSLTPFGCIIANSVLIFHRRNHCAYSVSMDTAFQGFSVFPTLLRLEGIGEVNNCSGSNGDRILHIQGGLSEQLCRAWLPSRGEATAPAEHVRKGLQPCSAGRAVPRGPGGDTGRQQEPPCPSRWRCDTERAPPGAGRTPRSHPRCGNSVASIHG